MISYEDSSIIPLLGEVKEAWLRVVLETPPTIPLFICSYGGDTIVSQAIVDWLHLHPREIIGSGFVASAALAIFTACAERSATESTRFHHHSPSIALPEEVKLQEVQLEAEDMDIWYKWSCKQLAKSSTKSHKFWTELGKSEGKGFSAKQALKWGLVTQILAP